MDSRTDTVTNAFDDPTEPTYSPHDCKDPVYMDADLDKVYDFYSLYNLMNTNADPDSVFSTPNQIDKIADGGAFGNCVQECLNVPLHPTAEPPESAEYVIADVHAIINNPHQIDKIPGVAATYTNLPLLDPVAHTHQSAELAVAVIQTDRNPGVDAISSKPHPKYSNLQWTTVAGILRSAEHATLDLHATVNNPHHKDGNLDVDAISSDANQDHPSPPLDPIAETLIINAGDASQTSRNRSRAQVLPTQTHTARSSNTRSTYPIDKLSSGSSPGMSGTNKSHTGNSRHKRRRTRDRESSGTDLAGRLSSSIIPTDCTSTSTGRTSMSSTSAAPTPADRELAFCPVCNMGDGKIRPPNNGTSAGTPGSIGQSTSQWKPDGPNFKVINPIIVPCTFKNHMARYHRRLFGRISLSDFSGFSCGLCACAYPYVCAARFRTWDILLEHVWEFHKHASLHYNWHYHCCDSVSASSDP